ncbi:MAG: metallophosphoesterase [Oscillospiraceae bacterium]|nr:metallophosphoesterase [Oscillospiraceae bacterium]
MKTVLRFIACSDIHYKENINTEPERFKRGMELAYKYADNQDYNKIDAIYVIGDFANSGSREQMLMFKDSLDKYVRPETKKILTLASHEFHSEDGEEGAYSRLREIFSVEPDEHNIINGFHFISVSTERGCQIREKKREWIANELKKAGEDDYRKPIFFFQHPHLTDTVYGSICWGEDDIITILMNYPQIIDFSGHSHAPINDPRSIHQKYFTSVGTGSLSYFELDEFDKLGGTVPADKAQCAQFHIVEVFEDNSVLIKPFDILSGNFFNDGYYVKKPWEPKSFVYTDKRYLTDKAPVFDNDTLVETDFADGKLSVTFSQAKGEERPNSYNIVIRAGKDNHIVKQVSEFSSYYIYDMPKTKTLTFDFDFKGHFTLELYANSFWKTQSEPIIKEFDI